MPTQNEELLQFFNERGYQPVLLARTNLTPPDVYELTEGSYERIGPLVMHLNPGATIPSPVIADAVDFGKETATGNNAELGFSFFKNILERFGIAGAEAKSRLAHDRDSTYQFKDVTIASVSVVDIEGALGAGFANDRFMSEAEAGSIHVAYEYIYAGKVHISNGRKGDDTVGLSGAVHQFAKISASASHLGKDMASACYENGTKPVVIAFKVGRLEKSGAYWKLRTRTGKAGFDPLSAKRAPYIYRAGEILTIQDRQIPAGERL